MRWVLAVRETVVIKPSRINIVAQFLYLLFPPPFPSIVLIHTPLFGWALIRLQASALAESITRKKFVAQHLHFTHIVMQVWFRATLHLSHRWSCALGQTSTQASALVHEGGTYHLVKRKKESFRNVCVRTRWRCGETWFPHSVLFRCVALTTVRGAYCDKLYRCIVGWLVVCSPLRELWLMVCRRPLVTIETNRKSYPRNSK